MLAIFVGLSFPIVTFAEDVASISTLPGENFVIPTVFHLSQNQIPSSASGNAGICFGFGQGNNYYCNLQKKIEKDGVILVLDRASGLMTTSTNHGYSLHLSQVALNNNKSYCSSKPLSSFISCNGGGSGAFPVFSIYGGGWLRLSYSQYYNYYNVSANIYSIKVIVLKSARVGSYEFPISISYINGGSWIATTKFIKVIVKPITCTLKNRYIKFGNISPGSRIKRDLNLDLQCNDNMSALYKASWKYTNVDNGNSTNLKNVFVYIKNNKTNTYIKNNESNKDLNLLNDNNLSIEIQAKPDAQTGHLKGTLNFTLTYY